ncbi:C45 family autoproteolytic acyltransferase/hydrolase [Leucobacter sp. HY1908]
MSHEPQQPSRQHLVITGATRAELGASRGAQLRDTLAAAYQEYAELFRAAGVDEATERQAAAVTLDTLRAWRPEIVTEFEAIASAAEVTLEQVAALNARTEVLAASAKPSNECSTIAALVNGRQRGVQTWDWHVELDPFWHTQEVAGPGYRFAGVTEQGIIGKIGVNERGLALHFNILGHEHDRPGGVPMHVLANVVLAECATVAEAIALVRAVPITSSSAFTLIDAGRAVSLEITPVGVFEIEQQAGAVVRTNHFQAPLPLERQKPVYEPDSSQRLALVQRRLATGLPAGDEQLVALLESGAGEPPLTCVPDMTQPLGERWATLCTVLTDPAARSLRVLDGTPLDAGSKEWRTLSV